MQIKKKTMHKYIFLLSALTVGGFSYGLDDLRGTSIEQCINCICFAKTNSWDIHLCARRLVTLSYWRTTGSLTTSTDWRPLFRWRSCRDDINCVLNTIKSYTEQFGPLDCNSDGEFNCRDRFAVQVWRGLCVNRRIASPIFNRFQTCRPNEVEPERGGGATINQDVKILVQQNLNGPTSEAKQKIALVVQ